MDLIATRLRVLTWNVWWRFGPWQRRKSGILATLEAHDPDVVALQEVWTDTSNGTGLADELAAALGYHVAARHQAEHVGFGFGNAVLSRWPIARVDERSLPAPPDHDERRLVLLAEIDGPRGPVQVFVTHLNWRFDHSAIRQEQVRAVAAFVADCRPRTYPAILCGDLNAAPDSDEVRMLTGRSAVPVDGLVFHDAWEVAGGGGPGWTWDNANPFVAAELEPDRRIDYVLVGWPKAAGAGHVMRCEVVGTESLDGVHPSDHYGVLAELRY